jgi:hypothetical protein
MAVPGRAAAAASAVQDGDRWDENLDLSLEEDRDCLSAWARDSLRAKAAMGRPVAMGLWAALQHRVPQRQDERPQVA